MCLLGPWGAGEGTVGGQGLDKLPSLHVLEAGLGGGGIEAASSSFVALLGLSLGSSGILGFFGGWMILNLHVSVMFQALFRSWPTLGMPPTQV